MAKNSFRTPKFVDHVIERDNRIIGTIRIKPSGIGWAGAESKKWRTISLKKFADFLEGKNNLKEK